MHHGGVQPEMVRKTLLLLCIGLLVEVGLLSLAQWQWRRYNQRLAEQTEAAARPPSQLQGAYLPLTAALTQQPNPVNPEESGWRMLGVLATSGSLVVIDRGFAAPRWAAPNVPDFTELAPPVGPQTLHGVWVPLPQRKGWLRGPEITTHPRLLAFLNPALLTSHTMVAQQLVLTVPETSATALLPSAPPLANPLRHLSYMIQWLVMAAVLPLLGIAAWWRQRRLPAR